MCPCSWKICSLIDLEQVLNMCPLRTATLGSPPVVPLGTVFPPPNVDLRPEIHHELSTSFVSPPTSIASPPPPFPPPPVRYPYRISPEGGVSPVQLYFPDMEQFKASVVGAPQTTVPKIFTEWGAPSVHLVPPLERKSTQCLLWMRSGRCVVFWVVDGVFAFFPSVLAAFDVLCPNWHSNRKMKAKTEALHLRPGEFFPPPLRINATPLLWLVYHVFGIHMLHNSHVFIKSTEMGFLFQKWKGAVPYSLKRRERKHQFIYWREKRKADFFVPCKAPFITPTHPLILGLINVSPRLVLLLVLPPPRGGLTGGCFWYGVGVTIFMKTGRKFGRFLFGLTFRLTSVSLGRKICFA